MSYLYRFIPFLVCLTILLWGILRPERPPELFDQSDKWMHLLAFCSLGLTSLFAFSQRYAGVVWLSLILSAIGLEYLQHFMQSSRAFSVEDIMANIVGVVIAFVFWTFVIKRWIAVWKRDNL